VGSRRNTRKKNSKKFKLDAISQVLEQGCSRVEAASSLGINANMLCRWIRQHEADDGMAFAVTGSSAQNRPRFESSGKMSGV